ncbi:MAG: transposase [Magnetococcales bacterium]|nr:transposase [Magnetococcales bacterium]
MCPPARNSGRDIATAYSRAREETEEFKKEYAIRAGGESVNAALKTAHGLGKVWTRRLIRVAFAVRMKALASNVKRFLRYRCAQMAGKVEKTELVPA